jgi:protease I
MSDELTKKRIAIIVADGFEQVELTGPRDALDEAGAETTIVSLKPGNVRGFKHHDAADEFDVDMVIDDARAEDFDGVLLPGGVMNPDALRSVPAVRKFVRDVYEAGKPVAAICHGPWTLIDAGLVRGKRMTSWPSLRTDLTNAGAAWVDAEVVVDDGIITSRKPDDIPKFNQRIIEAFAHAPRSRIAMNKSRANAQPRESR